MAAPIESEVVGVFLHVSDLARSAGWYAELLGQEAPEVFPNGHIAVLPMLRGTHLILDSKDFCPRVDRDATVMLDSGDIAAARRFVAERGIPVVREVEHAGPVSFFNVADPDGNVLMVCQRHQT